MSTREFTTKVESDERGRVFIHIPFDPQEAWGKRSRHYVKRTLNDHPFQGSLGVRSGKTFMPLNKELQKGASITPGDPVKVVMEADSAQQETLAEDFAKALTAAPESEKFFESLTVFQRNTYINWIEDAKKADTRAVRIQETVAALKAGQKQH